MLANPRRPSARAQERIVRRDPERSRVIEGAPARLSELLERFGAVTGRASSDAGFGEFVARQGRLALEREERSVTGDRYKVPRLVAEDITQSSRWAAMVARLAEGLSEPSERVAHRAEAAHDAAAAQP